MKKSISLLILSILLAGCFDFLPFNKYDSDPQPVTIQWNIYPSGPGEWGLEEKHDWGGSKKQFGFNGVRFSYLSEEWRDREAPPFGNLTLFKSLSPFGSMSGYLEYFLDGVDISAGATGVLNGNNHNVNYVTTTGLTQVLIPFDADIAGHPFTKSINVSDLDFPGNMAFVQFESQSEDSFLAGTGCAVFHDGSPGGLLYFAFEHRCGYGSLFFLDRYNNSQSGAYFGEMDGDYKWHFFPYPASRNTQPQLTGSSY